MTLSQPCRALSRWLAIRPKIVEFLRQQQQAAIQTALYRLCRDSEDISGFWLGQSLDTYQAENFTLLFWQGCRWPQACDDRWAK